MGLVVGKHDHTRAEAKKENRDNKRFHRPGHPNGLQTFLVFFSRALLTRGAGFLGIGGYGEIIRDRLIPLLIGLSGACGALLITTAFLIFKLQDKKRKK